jgi:hypothetical protein
VDKGWDKEISKLTPEWVSNIMDEDSDWEAFYKEMELSRGTTL